MSSDEKEEWLIERIVDIRKVRGRQRKNDASSGRPVELLVKWAGTDPDTGEPWPPSWVHQRDCDLDGPKVHAFVRASADNRRKFEACVGAGAPRHEEQPPQRGNKRSSSPVVEDEDEDSSEKAATSSIAQSDAEGEEEDQEGMTSSSSQPSSASPATTFALFPFTNHFFRVHNRTGFRLAAVLLRSGHIGLVLGEKRDDANQVPSSLDCFFPGLVKRVGPTTLLGAFQSPGQSSRLYLEALALINGAEPIAEPRQSLLYRSELLEKDQVVDCTQWLVNGEAAGPIHPVTLGAIETMRKCVEYSVNLHTVFGQNDLRKPFFIPCPLPLTRQSSPSCSICQDSFAGRLILAIHHGRSHCLVHVECCRQEGHCPHPRHGTVTGLSVGRFGAADDDWVSLPKQALVPPFTTQTTFPWLCDEPDWTERTWELLNGLINGVTDVQGGEPVSGENILSLSRQKVGVVDESQNEPIELVLIRGGLRALAVCSPNEVAMWRCFLGYWLIVLRNRLPEPEIQEKTGWRVDDLYYKTRKIGCALVDWPLLAALLIDGRRLRVSFNLLRLCLTKRNVALVRPRVLHHWRLLRLIDENNNNNEGGRRCEHCENVSNDNLTSVGDQHWWCAGCRRIQHHIEEYHFRDYRGVPTIGLTCYISALLQFLVASHRLIDCFENERNEHWHFRLPLTTQEADQFLLIAVANAMHALVDDSQNVTAQLVSEIKCALANTVNLEFYQRIEQPVNEVILCLLNRLQQQQNNLWASLGVWDGGGAGGQQSRRGQGKRDFAVELCQSWADAGLSGLPDLLVVERHNAPTEARPWDPLPSELMLNDATFQLIAFVVRTDTSEGAHFIAHRRVGDNRWVRCDNHLVEEIGFAEAQRHSVSADFCLYERRNSRVRFEARADGSAHPSNIPIYTQRGRRIKKSRKR